MKLFRRLVLLAFAGVFAVAAYAPAKGQQNTLVPMLICPFGCGPTEGYSILGNLMARGGEPITIVPQETPGYMYNVRAMAEERRWKTTTFGTEDTIVQMGPHGGNEEIKDYLPEPITVPFKLLFGEAFWGQGKFFVSYDQNIKTPADLKGKRIAIGLRTQSDFGFFAYLFLRDGYGVDGKNSDIRHVNPDTAIQQLIDGNADAAVVAFGTNADRSEWLISGPLRKLEAASKKINYIGIDEAALDKVNKKWGAGWLIADVPAGTLPLQEKTFKSGLNRGYQAAHPNFSEETAYHLIKSVAKYGPEMTKLHGLWKLWSPDIMLHGLTDENVHPGAKKAYIELGWWEKRKQFPPVVFKN